MPAVSASKPAVILKGEKDLVRAFSQTSKAAGKTIRGELRGVAKPIKEEAEELVHSKISGMARAGKVKWWRMRIGVTTKLVYVAPVQRGVKTHGLESRRRPNLAGRMIGYMDEALDDHRAEAVAATDVALSHLAGEWERI